MTPPTILTERLILAAPQASFFEAHLVTMSDPRVTARIGTGAPQSRIEAWRRYCQAAGLWSLVGHGYWQVLDRATGAVIGLGGLARFERGMAELEGVPEAGWAFNADWWGRGIASEFLAAVVAWSDATLAAPEVRCIIDPANAASIRVAEKAGFVAIGEARHDGLGSIVFTRRRR